jgi:hypothetical protein
MESLINYLRPGAVRTVKVTGFDGADVLVQLVDVEGGAIEIGRIPRQEALMALMLLIPALVDYLPGRLDVRARAYVRIVRDEAALRQMQRFVTLHQGIQGADDHATPELAQAADLSHHWFWGVARLLVHGLSHERLLVSERLFAALARQAAATRAAKEERKIIVARVPGVNGDTGGGLRGVHRDQAGGRACAGCADQGGG